MQPCDHVLQFLRQSYPEASVDVAESSAGAITIDIRCRDRFLVVQYSSRLGFGVSQVRNDDEAFTGHEHAFASSGEVIDYLKNAIR
jgi:hypothetical protein